MHGDAGQVAAGDYVVHIQSQKNVRVQSRAVAILSFFSALWSRCMPSPSHRQSTVLHRFPRHRPATTTDMPIPRAPWRAWGSKIGFAQSRVAGLSGFMSRCRWVCSDKKSFKASDILDGTEQVCIKGRVVYGWNGRRF